jgi:branched-chain amino acid aminotransferase
VFRLMHHLQRLGAAANRIGLPLPDGLAGAVVATVGANGLSDGAVRLTVTRGAAPPGLAPPPLPRPTVLITARAQAAGSGEGEGVRAIFASGRLNPRSAVAGLKHTGYMEGIVAQREALAAGVEEAILLNTGGDLAEAAAANLFVVRQREVLTPDTASGILPGITRAAVLEIAVALDLMAREQRLPRAVLHHADEAFLTSSLRGVVPILAVEGRQIGTGRPGDLTLRLAEGYRALVERETAGAGEPQP